ncbi:MAG TPA: Gfo/Idh/MocA family oxidoreductase [Halococcus sp.]|nr:Gfo/Idh/MocA family oxidoreductase [Halococcus sp.]
MNSAQSVRMGIVGLGSWGSFHATRMADIDAELVGGVDIDATARERFAASFDCSTHESLDGLVERGVDGVIITTPNRFHEEYAKKAFDAGLNVLIEKPLAHTLDSAERIVTAANNAPGTCLVGFKNRFLPAVEVIKGYAREGRFGDITHVEANYVRRRGIPSRGSWFTRRASAGGGSLVDIGVHAIDLALYFLDFPQVEEVLGRTRSQFGSSEDYAYLEMWGEDAGPAQFDVDDSATALLSCADGQTIAFECAWAADREPTDEFVLQGTEAGATFDRMSEELTIHEAHTVGAPHFVNADIETREVNPIAAEQRAFAESIRTGKAPDRNTAEQALAVQRILDAIQRSSERGAAVEIE